MVPLLGLTLMTFTSPLMAQTGGGSSGGSSSGSSQTEMNEPAGAANDRKVNWSWLGLLGLLGLMGLKRHRDVQNAEYKTQRS